MWCAIRRVPVQDEQEKSFGCGGFVISNSNGNITMRFNVDDVGEKMFELSLDSEHYINGFGRTLIACCDNAITDAEKYDRRT